MNEFLAMQRCRHDATLKNPERLGKKQRLGHQAHAAIKITITHFKNWCLNTV